MVLDRHVVAFDVTCLAETLAERGRHPPSISHSATINDCYRGHLRLLRPRHQRPRRRRCAEREEGTAVHGCHYHSITSSAMARMPGGMVRPSARAVPRLMTSSNLVGCMTGRSAGLAPLRMRPA